MSVPAGKGLVYILAGALLILTSRMFGSSGDIVADVAGAGLMWRGHTLRRPNLREHGFHRAFPFVLGIFATSSFLLGPEVAGLTRIWIIAWVAWVFLVANLPPGFRRRSRRFAERVERVLSKFASPAARPSPA